MLELRASSKLWLGQGMLVEQQKQQRPVCWQRTNHSHDLHSKINDGWCYRHLISWWFIDPIRQILFNAINTHSIYFRSTYLCTVLISTSSKHRDSHSPLHPVESRPLTRWSQRNLGHRASHHDSCRTGNRHLHTVFLRTRLLETVKHQLFNLGKIPSRELRYPTLAKGKSTSHVCIRPSEALLTKYQSWLTYFVLSGSCFYELAGARTAGQANNSLNWWHDWTKLSSMEITKIVDFLKPT